MYNQKVIHVYIYKYIYNIVTICEIVKNTKIISLIKVSKTNMQCEDEKYSKFHGNDLRNAVELVG